MFERNKKQAEHITRVHSIYVLNRKNELIGRLSLKDLITFHLKVKLNKYISLKLTSFMLMTQVKKLLE